MVELALADVPRLDRADLVVQLLVVRATLELLDELLAVIRLQTNNNNNVLRCAKCIVH